MNPLSFRKYIAVYTLSLQQELYQSATFLMDRARSITIVIAFFGFWSAVFKDRTELLGYTQTQMFTYVMGMNVLRALVFSDKTWEILREINTGKISAYLIRPISYLGYSISRDLADKTAQAVSSLLEITFAALILGITFYRPPSAIYFIYAFVAVLLAIILYFLMTYSVAALSFWTAESMGPRFCFELFVEFAAGAFFPLDILPPTLKRIFEIMPFASLLHFPLNVYLNRIHSEALMQGFCTQIFWILFFFILTRWIWNKGIKIYGADGG